MLPDLRGRTDTLAGDLQNAQDAAEAVRIASAALGLLGDLLAVLA